MRHRDGAVRRVYHTIHIEQVQVHDTDLPFGRQERSGGSRFGRWGGGGQLRATGRGVGTLVGRHSHAPEPVWVVLDPRRTQVAQHLPAIPPPTVR